MRQLLVNLFVCLMAFITAPAFGADAPPVPYPRAIA